mmetsp:Transcript_15844/g.24376  ORF Transcript_15844/g.24376 Transcript_15844/m.24376 type:complete len:164 (+) Transcript_15844:762-1253(+)
MIFVAGCEQTIRSFNVDTGDTIEYTGHRGWVYALAVHKDRLYSGGDDKIVIIWDIASGRMLETLNGHENAITNITFAFNDLYTASFDHHIICWDLQELDDRILEKEDMRGEDILSRRVEVYTRIITSKKGFRRVKPPPLKWPEPQKQKLEVVPPTEGNMKAIP